MHEQGACSLLGRLPNSSLLVLHRTIISYGMVQGFYEGKNYKGQ